MADGNQLSFGDGLLSSRRKISRLSKHLTTLDGIIDWQPLVQEISIIDKTDAETGGHPRKNPLWMVKAMFLQGLFSLSEPQLEAKGLMVKKRTIVDASIIPSSGRPLSNKKHIAIASGALLRALGRSFRVKKACMLPAGQKLAPYSATKNKSKNNKGFFKASYKVN
ncbi:MAG TPA: hypothetical protein VK074_04270 [Fodinibius sp.]|nr:hypothetical protein [Fodinibius sp.]